jgi:plasmid maintenance system antidote protein VapI
MSSKVKEINVGGVNGLGESLINTNSSDFRSLRDMIKSSFKSQDSEAKIENSLLSVRFQMESYINAPITLDEIKVPGLFIEKLLKAVNVNKKQLSEYIDYEYTNLISLLKGRRKINSDLAIKLGQIFKIDPVIWLHIENKNELLKEMSKTKDTLTLHGLLNKAS